MFLDRLNRDRATGGDFQFETHDGFVNAADLFHVQGPVAQSLTVQHQQATKHSEDHTVTNSRNIDRGSPLWIGINVHVLIVIPTFQERIAIRVEQISVTGRDFEVSHFAAVLASVVDQPEQGQQLPPGTVALVHRVREPTVITTQTIEQPGDGIVIGVYGIGRDHTTIFGVEDEHHPHQHRQQPVVNVLGFVGQNLTQEVATALVIGGLEST